MNISDGWTENEGDEKVNYSASKRGRQARALHTTVDHEPLVDLLLRFQVVEHPLRLWRCVIVCSLRDEKDEGSTTPRTQKEHEWHRGEEPEYEALKRETCSFSNDFIERLQLATVQERTQVLNCSRVRR